MVSSSSSSSSASRDTVGVDKSAPNATTLVPLGLDGTRDLDILDGLHRLAKAVILKHKTIKVKYVTIDILQKCRV